MAETKNPSLAELNEAIAKEHGIDPSTLKDYKLPEASPRLLEREPPDPRIATGEGIPAHEMLLGSVSRQEYAGIPRGVPEGPAFVTSRTLVVGQREKIVPIASKSTSCHSWSVEQMLEEMLRDIRAGKVMPAAAVLVYTVENPRGGHSVHSWRAQMGWTEELAYLEVAKDQTMRHARGE